MDRSSTWPIFLLIDTFNKVQSCSTFTFQDIYIHLAQVGEEQEAHTDDITKGGKGQNMQRKGKEIEEERKNMKEGMKYIRGNEREEERKEREDRNKEERSKG